MPEVAYAETKTSWNVMLSEAKHLLCKGSRSRSLTMFGMTEVTVTTILESIGHGAGVRPWPSSFYRAAANQDDLHVTLDLVAQAFEPARAVWKDCPTGG